MPTAPDRNRAAILGLPPELALLAAVVQQALHDVRSRRADVRQEAQHFLRDDEVLTWFGQQLGVEDVLQQQVRAVLGGG